MNILNRANGLPSVCLALSFCLNKNQDLILKVTRVKNEIKTEVANDNQKPEEDGCFKVWT